MIPSKYQANILTIPNKHQRYRTCADWYHDNDALQIRVSNMRNKDYEFLCAFKALTEQYLCEKAGISEQQVDSWRLLHESQDEPGAMLNCPYREHHVFAEALEKVVADRIGVDWVDYGITMERAMNEKTLKPAKPPKSDKPSRQALTLQTVRIIDEQKERQ